MKIRIVHMLAADLYFVRTVVLGLKIDLLYRNVELILVVMLYIMQVFNYGII